MELRGWRQGPGWRARFAVRRDWPVDGTHEFVGFRTTAEAAELFALRDREFWSKGPIRPMWSIVEISRRDFVLHSRRRACRAPDCPIAIDPERRLSWADRLAG